MVKPKRRGKVRGQNAATAGRRRSRAAGTLRRRKPGEAASSGKAGAARKTAGSRRRNAAAPAGGPQGTAGICEARIEISERLGRSVDRVAERWSVRWIEGPDGGTPVPGRPGLKGGHVADARLRGVSAVLAAAGHAVRLRMLGQLLTGPATYRAIKGATKLKPGPLYHHINQLRLAGLILPKQRDLYELTRAGRNVALIVGALSKLGTDKRRRPVPKG